MARQQRRDKCRVFTNADGSTTAYRIGSNDPILDRKHWVCLGSGVSYIETDGGERVDVAHYIPEETFEQFQRDGIAGSRRRNELWSQVCGLVRVGGLSPNEARKKVGYPEKVLTLL